MKGRTLIVQLDSNGPAAQAGLVEGDTIAQIDGKDITTLLGVKRTNRRSGDGNFGILYS